MKPEEWENLARNERILRCEYERALRDIKAEAYGRESVPSEGHTKDALRGAALALTGRLSQIERFTREALTRSEQTGGTE